ELPVIQPEAPKKAELLKQIETISLPAEPKPMAVTQPAPQNIPPSPFSAPMGNFAETKLAGMFTMPKEEKKIAEAPLAPTAPKQYGTDPYREPTK
ncbi:MAG TPA: hypothetical protein VJI74_03535, partial [Candidatus Paceibacterota bacterium]